MTSVGRPIVVVVTIVAVALLAMLTHAFGLDLPFTVVALIVGAVALVASLLLLRDGDGGGRPRSARDRPAISSSFRACFLVA